MAFSSAKQYGFIHVASLNSAQLLTCSWALIKAGQISAQGEGSIEQAITECGKHPCALALPVSDLVITHLTLPTKNDNQRHTAIPFAIQNQLADNAKQLHWSWRALGQKLQLVGLPKHHLNALREEFESLNFSPKWLLADGLHMGGTSNVWRLYTTPSYWLIQTGEHQTFRVEINQQNTSADALTWLQMAYQEAQQSAAGAPLSIDICGAPLAPIEQWLHTQNITHSYLQDSGANGDSAVFLGPHFNPKTAINLWPKNPIQPRLAQINWRRWRLPYALAVAIGLVLIGQLWLTNQTLAQQVLITEEQGHHLFRQTLPNERIIDPLSQLESHLLGAKVPAKKPLLLPLIYQFQQLRQQLDSVSQGAQIDHFKFTNGQLEVTLSGTEAQLKGWPKDTQDLGFILILTPGEAH